MRLQKNPKISNYRNGFDVTFQPLALNHPARWKAPARIFVCSMADLFHTDVPTGYQHMVFETIADVHWHDYLILTKRPATMQGYIQEAQEFLSVHFKSVFGKEIPWPLPNVWLGTSVESADYLDRVDTLREIPAAVRFLSIEPLLGPLGKLNLDGIHWVIVGGESGPGARPMHPDWAREIRDQCQAAGVPFFFKQWGEWIPSSQMIYLNNVDFGPSFPAKESGGNYPVHEFSDEKGPVISFKIGKKLTGRLLDGREWNEMPKGVRANV